MTHPKIAALKPGESMHILRPDELELIIEEALVVEKARAEAAEEREKMAREALAGQGIRFQIRVAELKTRAEAAEARVKELEADLSLAKAVSCRNRALVEELTALADRLGEVLRRKEKWDRTQKHNDACGCLLDPVNRPCDCGISRMDSDIRAALAEWRKWKEGPGASESALPSRDAFLKALTRALLPDGFFCTRVWEAWQAGTMTQDDFEPIDCERVADEILEALRAQGKGDG